MPRDTALGSRFEGERHPAWHDLGLRSFDSHHTASQAIESTGLQYEVKKEPLYIAANGSNGASGTESEMQLVEGRVAIVRPATVDFPKREVYGIAGPGYTIIQNTDLGKLLDPLSEKWAVDSIGTLDSGRTIMLVLDAGPSEVNGDEMHEYFLVVNRQDGGSSIKIAYTPLRMRCINQLSTGLAKSTLSAAINHGRDANRELSFRIDLFGRLKSAQAQVRRTFEQLGNLQLNAEQIEAVIQAAYPDPKQPGKADLHQTLLLEAADRAIKEGISAEEAIAAELDEETLKRLTSIKERHEYSMDRITIFRQDVHTIIERFNDEQPALANTAWGVYNSVVEFADYRQAKNPAVGARDALFGPRAQEKHRAMHACVQYLGKGAPEVSESPDILVGAEA